MDDEPKTKAALRNEETRAKQYAKYCERQRLESLLPAQEQFMFAIRDANFDLIEEFLKSGEIDVNDKKGLHNHTPLHRAAQYGSVKIIQLILEHGGDVRAKNSCSQSPLHTFLVWRCRIRNKDRGQFKMSNRDIEIIVCTFLQHGADVNLSGHRGETPLQRAVVDCTWIVVKILLDHGAKISKTDDKGYNALHALCDRIGAASVRNKIAKTMLERISDHQVMLKVTGDFAYVNFNHDHDDDLSGSDTDSEAGLNNYHTAEDLAEIYELPGLADIINAAHMLAFMQQREVENSRRAKKQAEKSEDDRQRKTAVAMALHSRLGDNSSISTLGRDILGIIAKNM
jgi:hypothetical protein